ncbi:UNVERIFIED_CONTAM: hypothetical protein HDU68_005956, partial [Siphonaria sp. JEL0065]
YPTGKRESVTEEDQKIIRTLLNMNPQRRALVQMIAILANKILANDPVEASSLAVVIPVHNVNACGSIAAEAMMKRMALSGKNQDATTASEMRALVEVFEEWNKVLGLVFSEPEFFF